MREPLLINTAIAVIEEDGLYRPDLQAEQLQAVLSSAEMVSAIVNRIRELAIAEMGYPLELMKTKKGRDTIKAAAAKVIRSKTYFDDLGKQVVATLKELPNLIDGNRKFMRDALDEVAAAIRKPLTDFEERTEIIGARLVELDGLPTAHANSTAEETEIALDHLRETSINPVDWDGLFGDANAIYSRVEPIMAAMVIRKRKEEADAAELAQLRRLHESRAAQDAEDARIKAAAERESQAALGREAEARRQAAISAERAAAAEAETSKLREQIAAAPVYDFSLPPRSVPDKPVAAPDLDARKAINRAAAAAVEKVLVEFCLCPMPAAQAIVRAIIRGEIPNISITY